MHVPRLQRAFACLALIAPACATAQLMAPTAPQNNLHMMVESAWQRSPQARALAARQDEADAAQELAASWLAAPPVLGLAQRNERWTGQHGKRESEVALSSTIWTPGQKTRRARFAQASAEELAAQLALARLELAGQVRSRLWEAAAAREAAAEHEDHLRHLQELALDAQRRVDAGDLPRSDALLARQEVFSAQARLLAARSQEKAALARFKVLTGRDALPDAVNEPVPAAGAPAPIRLQAAKAAEQRARAGIASASAQPESAPSVTLSMRRERDSSYGPSDRSVGIALQIPLTGAQRNRPFETAAATQLASASAELELVQAEIDAELAVARDRVQAAQESLALAEQSAAAAQEHTRLYDKAFALGERPLPDLLRSRTQAHEAQLAVRQQRVALGRALADLNQALGIVP